MIQAPALLLAALAATPAPSSSAPATNNEAPKLVVLEVKHLGKATEAEAQALDDTVVALASKSGVFQVISQKDISTLLGVERQRQLLGCSEDASNCFAELSGALDARFILSGSLNRIGNTYQLSLQTLDAQKGQPVGRSLRVSKSLNELRNVLPWAVADAMGTPPPKAPSRVVPTVMMVVGGVAVLGGGVVLFQSETREQSVLRELQNQSLPRSVDDYRADAREFAADKTSSLLLLSLGASLVAAGAIWYFTTPDVNGARIALVPSASGVALVGVFQ